jgi:CheY-like chemotaxis protein
LQQVVWNLLANAVKFTPAGGRVDVSLSREENAARISVSDTGIGISKEFLPHVFERFRQADASTTRQHGGLGLGLGIVRHLTELHGGTVHATSAGPNQGSTFTVTFPLVTKSEEARPSASAMGAGAGEDHPLRGVNVLLVEDDATARELATRVLADSGATIDARASAADAIEAFRLRRPDVIVSDIGMPDEDGYSLIQRIRTLSPPGDAAVPAVALTALARAEDRQRAIKAGFQVHVSKPFDPRELSDTIAKLVRRPASSG